MYIHLADWRSPGNKKIMIVRQRHNRRRNLIAALIVFLWSAIAGGQPETVEGTWLELAGIDAFDNGDLISWRVNGLDTGGSDLVESGASLLALKLTVAERDVSDRIAWRRAPPGPGMLAEFIGIDYALGLEIHRRYYTSVNVGAIVHEVEFSLPDNPSADQIRIQLWLQPKMVKHAPNDGSLGEVFYGYTRIFAAAAPDVAFEPVRDQSKAVAAALVVRHAAVVLTTDPLGNAELMVDPEFGAVLTFDASASAFPHRQLLGAMKLGVSTVDNTIYCNFMYSDTWTPLRGLARLIERSIQALTVAVGSPGLAVILFAILLRAMLMPLGLWSIRQQRHFAEIQRQMKPTIAHISKTLKGATKSERILATYKEYGVSPFSGLKGSIGLFIQLPILIALFAVTTESILFRDASFLWASDISLPDRAFAMPFSIPGLGGFVNLLPILLGVICVAAALIQARSAVSRVASSPRSGLFLALAFVVFFYSCAAALVLYWMVVNLSQILEGIYVTRSTPALESASRGISSYQ